MIPAIWYDGFKFGQKLKEIMPYQAGTLEAKIWISGWEEGAAQFLLIPYCKTPEEKELMPPAVMNPVGLKWRAMLRERYFPDSA